ncbi:NAD(P)-dependent glycerol-3-phosphate dehydrogenase [bacterium]|nr:NAD(P)-dependent glycerol-3-phosphate dehydrogenase [bacterium]
MGNKATVIGSGSWGTAIASLLAINNISVSIYCRNNSIAEDINSHRKNSAYFPGTALPEGIQATGNLLEALNHSDTVYLVVPTKFIRSFILSKMDVWRNACSSNSLLINCTKGLLLEPTQRTDDWLAQTLPGPELLHLSGPNLASEIMAGLPAAAVVCGRPQAAALVQQQLLSERFRVYTGTDMVGVEVSGFYKNILAIAAGLLTELGLGNNARAALITRGLAEMSRLTEYFGGDPASLSGLAGLGDLIVTCSSELSRNFQVGMRLGRGQGLAQIESEMTQVAEGVQASRALHEWPADHGLEGWPDLPIAEEVYSIVHCGADPRAALSRLMTRPPRSEATRS